MEDARFFRDRIDAGEVLVGPSISLTDPIVAEILVATADFLWIDAEHNPLTPEVVQRHLLAVKGSRCPAIVRVPAGDTNFVKHVLDSGADGVIGPRVRSVEKSATVRIGVPISTDGIAWIRTAATGSLR